MTKTKCILLMAALTLPASFISCTGAYLALLQHKENANKFALIAGDFHEYAEVADAIQIRTIEQLLDIIKKIPAESFPNLDFLFECSDIDIDASPLAVTKEKVPNFLLQYLWSLYGESKLPEAVHAQGCDVKNYLDFSILFIGEQIFGDIKMREGTFKSAAEWARRKMEDEEKLNFDHITLTEKGKFYDVLIKEPERFTYVYLSEKPTIELYKKRIEYLRNLVFDVFKQYPEYAAALKPFVQKVLQVKKMIEESGLPPTAHLSRLAVTLLEKSKNEKEAAMKFYQLFDLISRARDVIMLGHVLKSQEAKDITLFFAGLHHALSVQDALLAQYTILQKYDVLWDISDIKGNRGAKILSEPELWDVFGRLGKAIPTIQKLMPSTAAGN